MCPRSAQLKALFAILTAADSALAAHLRDIGAGECFFAYRMLVGVARMCLSRRFVHDPDTGCHFELLIQGLMCGCAGTQVVLLRREMTQEEVSAHTQRSLHASLLHLACLIPTNSTATSCCMCTLMCVRSMRQGSLCFRVCAAHTMNLPGCEASGGAAQAMQLWEALWADACWQRLAPSTDKVRCCYSFPAARFLGRARVAAEASRSTNAWAQ